MTFTLRLMTVIILISISVAACSDSSTEPDPEEALLETELVKLTKQYDSPAALGIVLNSDSVLELNGEGFRKAGQTAAVTPEDLIHIGSVTKSMVSVMIARLVESGKLSWNSKPSDVIPGLGAVIDAGYADITLLDILHHRAGIPADEDFDPNTLPEFDGTLPEQRVKWAKWALANSPAHEPGSFVYSNLGYAIAACMAEQATGIGWRDLMNAQLFQPLGIEAYYGWPTSHDPNQPWGHELTESGFVPVEPSVYPDWIKFLEPSGDISMTIGDLGRFMDLILDAQNGRPRLLNSSSFEILFTPVGDYACGMMVVETIHGTLMWHNGSNDYFYLMMYILPEADIAAAIVVNGYSDNLSTRVQVAVETVVEARLKK